MPVKQLSSIEFFRKYPFFNATIINLILVGLVYLFLTPNLLLDDLYVMFTASGFLDGNPSEYLIISNVLAGKFLNWLYSILPGFNWYAVILIAITFICQTIILYLLIKKSNLFVGLIIFITLFFAFGIEFYIRIHYTYVAFLVGFTALYLLFFQEPERKNIDRHILSGILVIALFIVAFLIRKSVFEGIFSFVIFILAYHIYKERKISFIIISGILLVVGFLLNNYDKNQYAKKFNPGYFDYMEAQYVINPENNISKDISEDILRKFGWSENDMTMFKNWLFADKNIYPENKLIEFSETIKKSKSIGESLEFAIKDILMKPESLKYFPLLLIVFLFIKSEKSKAYFWVSLINILLVFGGLIVFKNLPYRVYRPVWYFLLLFNIFIILYHQPWKMTLRRFVNFKKVVITLLLISAGFSLVHAFFQNRTNRFMETQFIGVTDELKASEDFIFVFNSLISMNGFKVFSNPQKFQTRNIIVTDWLIYSPTYFDVLKFHGINKGLLEEVMKNEQVMLVGCSHLQNVLETYYKDHYNSNVTYKKLENYKFMDAGAIIPKN